MSNDHVSAKETPPAELEPEEQLVLSPPTDSAFVTDTASQFDVGAMLAAIASLPKETLAAFSIQFQRTKTHKGPLPAPETLRELNEVYPNAAKILFEEFRAQSAHRRALELSVVTNNNLLARRGQFIAGGLGAIALLGGTVIAGLGFSVTGFSMVIGSIAGLVGVFIFGRMQQKHERQEKEQIRQRIAEGAPIEELEPKGKPPESTR